MIGIILRASFGDGRLWIAGCLSLAFAGCATIAPVPGPGEEFLVSHYILAHEDGFALSKEREPGRLTQRKLSVERARRDVEENVFAAGIDAYLRRLWPNLDSVEPKPERPVQLLVFVHGGLNGYRDDFRRMRQMLATEDDCHRERGSVPSKLFVTAKCEHAKTAYYPVFFNWNSELWDSIGDDLFLIRFGERSPIIALLTSPFVVASRAAESILNAPNGLYANFKNFDDSEFVVDWGTPLAPARVLATPVAKTFGAPAWQIMYRRADLLVSPALSVEKGTKKPHREGAAWSFLRTLERRVEVSRDGVGWWRIGNRKIPVEITMIGHSMGSIVLNRLLAVTAQLENALPIKRVVYLAPAASVLETEMSVLPFLRSNPRARFWTFALDQKDEARELHWSKLSPRGTLLVWIDSFFEPVTELGDKRFGRSQAFKTYYFSHGDLPESAKENNAKGKPFNYCEWNFKSTERPTTHGAAGDPTHLEAILWHVSAELFDRRLEPRDVPVKCSSASVSELFSK